MCLLGWRGRVSVRQQCDASGGTTCYSPAGDCRFITGQDTAPAPGSSLLQKPESRRPTQRRARPKTGTARSAPFGRRQMTAPISSSLLRFPLFGRVLSWISSKPYQPISSLGGELYGLLLAVSHLDYICPTAGYNYIAIHNQLLS